MPLRIRSYETPQISRALLRFTGCSFFLAVLLAHSVDAAELPFSQQLVQAARAQVGVTKSYVADYVKLDYPLGDVPQDRGVCTDVVIRALRACGHDLQVLVHLHMKQHFSAYPKNWGLKTTDRNIDHRRVPNLITYFTRKGMRQPKSDDPKRFQPGDLVTCLVAQNLPHIMIVSDRRGPSGDFLVLHNIGAGAQEEDCLHRYPHTGHFRWK